MADPGRILAPWDNSNRSERCRVWDAPPGGSAAVKYGIDGRDRYKSCRSATETGFRSVRCEPPQRDPVAAALDWERTHGIHWHCLTAHASCVAAHPDPRVWWPQR